MLRKMPITDKFAQSLINKKRFSSASTSYGIANEKNASQLYQTKTQNHVHDCGLIINPEFPCIGATPDGKVCDHGESGILEIKCPFSARDMSIEEALTPDSGIKDFFLEKNDNNVFLKKSHQYWFQIQGQLLVSGANFCDLVIYTRRDFSCIRILPDIDAMEEILSKMCSVYCKLFPVKS